MGWSIFKRDPGLQLWPQFTGILCIYYTYIKSNLNLYTEQKNAFIFR